ncbi:MAG: dihydroorotase [bacterium]
MKKEYKKILIANGTIIDPAHDVHKIADLLIEGNTISRIAAKIKPSARTHVINAQNKWVTPGIIDMHVHLREPGREDQETIRSGTTAAALSGTTMVVCMANTIPPTDNVSEIRYVIAKAESEGLVRVSPAGAITKELKGKEIAEIGSMAENGARAFSDDGYPVMDSGLMRKVMEYSKDFKIVIIDHSEDISLSKDGVMNEGLTASIMGLKGIPNQAEYGMIARNVSLAELTGAHIHFAHVSTAESVEIIRQAKARGVPITAETCPHYFSLTEEIVKGYNTNAKVNPPLRTARDVKAIIEGLQDNTIDVIASDHAPHTYAEKAQEFDRAPCGMIGIETLLPLTITQLVLTKKLTPLQAIAKLTLGPAHALRMKKYSLTPGETADITVIDPKCKKKIERFASLSRNSPFIGWDLTGFAYAAILNGRVIMERGRLVCN